MSRVSTFTAILAIEISPFPVTKTTPGFILTSFSQTNPYPNTMPQQLQKLKSENEKLKSENRALTRVVSKLTSAATKCVPATPGPTGRK